MSEELPIIADGKLVGRIAKTGNKLSFRQNKKTDNFYRKTSQCLR